MTFSKIKNPGWQKNEKVTSTQFNALDLDHSNALDKRGDNASNGGGISGRIDLLSTGLMQVQSGGVISLTNGATLGLLSGSVLTGTSNTISLNGPVITISNASALLSNSILETTSATQLVLTGGSLLTIDSSSSTIVNGIASIQGRMALGGTNIGVGSSPFTVSLNGVVGCKTTSGAITVNLPNTTGLTNGTIVIIKDTEGAASGNNITVVPTGGVNIEGVAANKLIQADWGSLTLISVGVNWFIL